MNAIAAGWPIGCTVNRRSFSSVFRKTTMTRRLPILLGLVGALALTSSAEAGRGHFSGGVHFGGGARGWSGGVRVSSGWHFSRPTWRPRAWNVTGHVYVGSYYYPRPYYYYYQPTYVPS